MDEKRKLKIKRIITVISVVVVVALFLFLTYFFTVSFKEIRDVQSFKDYVLSYGAKGVIVGFGFQLLQVFVAFIPGEIIEIGLGFAFGAVRGTLICYAGLAVASFTIFLLVKTFGMRLVELFVSREKLSELRFIKKNVGNPERLRKIAFILFFIPGTPKDLFTYFFGLTPLTLGEFLAISLIARIPTVVSSTVGGMLIHNRNYTAAAILFAVTALLSIAGWFCYDSYSKRKNKDKD